MNLLCSFKDVELLLQYPPLALFLILSVCICVWGTAKLLTPIVIPQIEKLTLDQKLFVSILLLVIIFLSARLFPYTVN